MSMSARPMAPSRQDGFIIAFPKLKTFGETIGESSSLVGAALAKTNGSSLSLHSLRLRPMTGQCIMTYAERGKSSPQRQG